MPTLEHERPGGSGPEATVALLARLKADGRIPLARDGEADDAEAADEPAATDD